MAYYYDSNYLLPLSHDEVVHGKATILQKMFGDYEMKFPQARAFYMYMYAHPGKKLTFSLQRRHFHFFPFISSSSLFSDEALQ